MAAVGVDLGTYKTVIAAARNRGIDILVNEVSNRFTPTLVGFTPTNRVLGETAKAGEVMNAKNTVGNMKHLIGRSFNDPAVQAEAEHVTCNLVEMPDGSPGASVSFLGEQTEFDFTQLQAMLLTKVKQTAEAELKNSVELVCLTVPAHYTFRQRIALNNAASIAGLKVARLMSEPAACALLYGITRKGELPEETEAPRYVVFADMGHTAFTVSVVKFTQKEASIIGMATTTAIGGRFFDSLLVRHFAAIVQEKHKYDIFENKKAILRLTVACERLKKILSSNPIGALNVECLTDTIDLSAMLKREEFEAMIGSQIAVVHETIAAALAQAKITKAEVNFVEQVGGSIRVPIVKEHVQNFFGSEVTFSATLNFDEAAARGAAFQCAMQSPMFSVRDYVVRQTVSHDIALRWTNPAGEEMTRVVLTAGEQFLGKKRSIAFDPALGSRVSAIYANPAQLPHQTPEEIAHFITPAEPLKEGTEFNQLEVLSHINLDGVFEFTKFYVRHTVPAAEPAEGEEAPAGPTTVRDAITLPVVYTFPSLSAEQLNLLRERENEMIAEDKLVFDTLERKNSLEEFIYRMRDLLDTTLAEYVAEADMEAYKTLLRDTEDWLYGEGENVSKSVYEARLSEVRVLGDAAQYRFDQAEALEEAKKKFQAGVTSIVELTRTQEERYEHIDAEAREAVMSAATAALADMTSRILAQQAAPKHAHPTLLSENVDAALRQLQLLANSTFSKPKPKPVEPEPAAAAPEGAEAAPPTTDSPMETTDEGSSAPATDMDID
ncbi:hypothetical protein, variant [Fonticula alba]|nr:hypothetical protein, variant [Fonticula alba]KCV73047.1 hypothetical protein, variant [Fonticula alba]|eukprot:XP_009492748.1 hypothetical protein, variant [Fonticula alba]